MAQAIESQLRLVGHRADLLNEPVVLIAVVHQQSSQSGRCRGGRLRASRHE